VAEFEPPSGPLRPAVAGWLAGRPIVRAHPSDFGATEFNGRPDTDNRFSPIRAGRGVVPVLHGAADVAAAASETIVHTIPAAEGATRELRPRQVPLAPYVSWVWSTVACRRDLTLVSLRGDGFRRLGVTRAQLILGGRGDWPVTRRWAEALHRDAPHADGLWWTSRQAARRDAVMLFGRHRGRAGGVARSDLQVVAAPLPFLAPEGFERLSDAAIQLNVTLLLD
jgi:hypothetical protein